jgi:OOP family OmpA-OmpF porin
VKKPRKPEGRDAEDVQRLRDLILGEEKDRLHKLDLRVSDLESRTSDVAEVLPAAMNRLAGDPASQPEFEKPVVDTIRGAIQRDTQSFAEALFPVLGPAIRRAVADSLKGLVQRINVALENSLTIKGLKWRVEAARTGVPFAQIVLRHTMLYAVQEAFLIQRGSGLILASVHRDELLALDEDAVAAMLTAIQSFIQDSFGMSTDETLRSAELGERTVWVVNGPAAALACVITGTPPRSLRAELMALLETLHARFGSRFGENPERLAGNEGLTALMNEALRGEVDETTRSSTSFKYKVLWFTGGVLLLLYLLFTSINAWRDRQFTRQVGVLFAAEPGYVLTASEMNGEILKLSGLRDPDAVELPDLLETHQIPSHRITADFSPYQSLDTELVISRIVRRFSLGQGTALSLDDGELTVTGTLSSRQMAGMKQLPQHHVVIRRLNLEGIILGADEAAVLFREALQAPDSVRFSPAGTTMAVSGVAHSAWYAKARQTETDVPGWQLDFQPLRESLSAQLDTLLAGLDAQVFRYSDGYDLTAESNSSLEIAAAELIRAQRLAAVLDSELKITLEGSGDGIGSREKNIEVSMNRSRHVLDELIALGVNPDGFEQAVATWNSGRINPDRRRVSLFIKRSETP